MIEIVALAKSHADLSASAAYRWMACGGSVRLSRGKPNRSSPYAIEGAVAHIVGERCLTNPKLDIDSFVGLEIKEPESKELVEITQEMADNVSIYTNYCKSLMRPGSMWWVERKFSLATLDPPDDMYGTSDFPVYEPAERVLEIVDLKYGQGVTVEVEENEQEMYYALGAVMAIQAEERLPIERVKITIVQPRIPHINGPIRSWEISIEELLAFADRLLVLARRALSPDAPLVPGDHCRFCPVAGECPALSRHAGAIAQVEFDDIVDVPPSPETLPAEVLAHILDNLDILTAWANAVRANALARLEQGQPVPGYKAVPKRASRKWINPEEVAERLDALGFTQEQVIEQKVRSVAQLEKKVGPAKFGKMIGGAKDLIEKVSSGYTLAPDADVRPALPLGAQNDFSVLP